PTRRSSDLDAATNTARDTTMATFWLATAAIIGAALLAGILAWAGTLTLARLIETVLARLRETYVKAAFNLPRATVEAAGTGDIVTRASDDIAQLSETLPTALPRVFTSTFTLLLVFIGLGTLDPAYLLGFVIILPIYLVTVRWYVRTAPTVYAA